MNANHKDSGVDVDVAVIGAGVLGLASAAALIRAGYSVIVLERHEGPGRETSSRNSEVIHAGIYYPPGSLKASLCVEGNRLLYRFCEEHGVAHQRLGKLIVATCEAERGELERLHQTGLRNGAAPLQLLEGSQVAALEPRVRAVAGLLSPSTGIVDSHGLIKALEAITRNGGGQVLYRCKVIGLDPQGGRFQLALQNPAGEEQLQARLVVNAAGLDADRVAAMAGVQEHRHHWCKGVYFAVTGKRARLVSRLVYPVPCSDLEGLGIHVTLDLSGNMRLGPDAAYLERRAMQLDVDPARATAFCQAVNRYLPEIRVQDLSPGMAGIRPKLQGPGQQWRDFVIEGRSEGRRRGLINLVGMESPGLTCCLAVAQEVLRLAQKCH